MKRIFEIEQDKLKEYLDLHLTYREIGEKFGCSSWTVMERAKEYGLKSDARTYQMQTDNPALKDEVRRKISDSVKKMWDQGNYSERINGMTNCSGSKHSSYREEGYPCYYRMKAKYYHPEATCVCCGKQLSWDDDSIEVHHVDHDTDNFSLSNLAPLCHSCHRKYHRKSQFFCTVTKSFVFDACHYLPYHDRKCKFLHGHTYHMDISIRNAVLHETGMVADFNYIKRVVEEEVIDVFDHGFLNEQIEYPTCELMSSWIWFKLSKRLKGISSIKLWETDGSVCEMTSGNIKYYLQHFESDWNKPVSEISIPNDEIGSDGRPD